MKYFYLYIWIILFLSQCNCSKNQESNILKKVFQLPISSESNIPFSFHLMDLFPHNDRCVIVNGYKNNRPVFMGIDINQGIEIWSISPTFHTLNLAPYNFIYYDYWYIGDKKKIKKIKISTGEVDSLDIPNLEKTIYDDIKGEDYYYLMFEDVETLHIGNALNNTISKVPKVSHQTKHINEYNHYYNILDDRIIKKNGNYYVFITYSEPSENNKSVMVYKSSLYDIANKNWIYDGVNSFDNNNKETNSTELDMVFVTNTIYDYSGTSIEYAINMNNGKLVWKNNLKGEGFIRNTVYETKIHTFMLSSSGNGVCLNKKTGQEVFKFEAHGGGVMQAKGDVVYFVSSDYKLRAIDAHTGKTLTAIESPLGKPFDLFATSIGVVDNKIIVHNYKNVYCYEAIR